ncbi:MAG: hypothetical protein WC624_03970 [Candidatus Margulisiibacteriota bacterium]
MTSRITLLLSKLYRRISGPPTVGLTLHQLKDLPNQHTIMVGPFSCARWNNLILENFLRLKAENYDFAQCFPDLRALFRPIHDNLGIGGGEGEKRLSFELQFLRYFEGSVNEQNPPADLRGWIIAFVELKHLQLNLAEETFRDKQVESIKATNQFLAEIAQFYHLPYCFKII